MRKNYIIFLFIAHIFLLASCSKFLDESYDNRVALNSVEALKAVVINAYPERTDLFTEIMTDNFHFYGGTMQASIGPTYLPLFLWEDNYSDNYTIATPISAYSSAYNKIYAVNAVIEKIGELSGNQAEKDAVLGEALILRAYNYFNLINLFSLHYDEANNSKI